jgi:hypothetical protein
MDQIEHTVNGAAFIRTGRHFTDGLLGNNVNGEARRCNAEGFTETAEVDEQGNVHIRKLPIKGVMYVEAQMMPVHPQRIERIAYPNIKRG